MPKAVYINIDEGTKEVRELQINIMSLVDAWVRKEKTPVPKRVIIQKMQENGIRHFKTDHALNLLIRTGYIRRAFSMSNKAAYVQLKSIRIKEYA